MDGLIEGYIEKNIKDKKLYFKPLNIPIKEIKHSSEHIEFKTHDDISPLHVVKDYIGLKKLLEHGYKGGGALYLAGASFDPIREICNTVVRDFKSKEEIYREGVTTADFDFKKPSIERQTASRINISDHFIFGLFLDIELLPEHLLIDFNDLFEIKTG